MFRVLAGAAAVCLAVSSPALSQECNSLLDTAISPMSFDAAVESLKAAPLVKDEFETTAAYQARVAAAQQGMPAQLAISVDLHKDSIVYDADRQKFVVNSRAFGSEYGVEWFSAFYEAETKPAGYTLGANTTGIALSSTDNVTGTRTAQNAYGATWDVVEITRDVDAIFNGVGGGYDQKLFGRGIGNDFKWDLPVPSANARDMKEGLRGAFVVVPKAPFFIESTQSAGGRITIQNPRDVTQHARVIVADVRCAVLTNAENYVLMAITTN